MKQSKSAPKLLLSLPVLLCAILVLLYFHGLTFDPNKTASRLVDKPVPLFNLPSLFEDGKLLQSEQIKGPAIINVWAAWCGACRAEHAQLLRIGREEGIPIYGVDYQDDAETARIWLKQSGNPFTWVMFDGASAVAHSLDVFSLPQTYAVDAKGVVRARHIGSLTPEIWQTMREAITATPY
ncbi:MAG: DsbE family thiol:disulfide interchange protein [Methylococcales bacterium]